MKAVFRTQRKVLWIDLIALGKKVTTCKRGSTIKAGIIGFIICHVIGDNRCHHPLRGLVLNQGKADPETFGKEGNGGTEIHEYIR